MDDFISSSVDSIISSSEEVQNNDSESNYDTVESMSIESFSLGQNAAIGFGAGGSCLLLSLMVAGIIKILYRA